MICFMIIHLTRGEYNIYKIEILLLLFVFVIMTFYFYFFIAITEDVFVLNTYFRVYFREYDAV